MKKCILLFTILIGTQHIFSWKLSYVDLTSKAVSLYNTIRHRLFKKIIDLEQFRIFSHTTFDDVIGMREEKEK